MDPTTNPIIIAFSALILPLLIALVKQAKWPNNVNALIAFAVYAVVGTVGALAVSGKPDLSTIVPFIATVTIVGKAAYDLFWSQLSVGSQSFDNALTEATSIFGGPGPAKVDGA